MTQLNEAIARYHRIIESDTYNDLEWFREIEQKFRNQKLLEGSSPISPVLRPHLLTQKQYTGLIKATEALYASINRVEQIALQNPALMSRMQMLPAEKMLAAVDPGYPYLAVTSLMDTHLNNGTLRFVGYAADTPAGAIYGEALNNIYYDAPPVKEFRKKYNLAQVAGSRPLLSSLLKAYKEFGGKEKPNIAILEFRHTFQSAEAREYMLITEMFRREGYEAEVVSPDQLEYRNGVLRKGNFNIHLIYRRLRVSEFLVRFDLNHPLVRAYRERAVCVVNSFRSELTQKKAMFDLLTDEKITSSFPAAERKAIREFIPWTRVVTAGKTTYQDQVVDLYEFITANRERLLLLPNDDSSDRRPFVGAELDSGAWDRALRTAARGGYVVQETTDQLRTEFPIARYGEIQMRELKVDVHPHTYLGRVNGVSSWVSPAVETGFSTISGLAPTFVLESK